MKGEGNGRRKPRTEEEYWRNEGMNVNVKYENSGTNEEVKDEGDGEVKDRR